MYFKLLKGQSRRRSGRFVSRREKLAVVPIMFAFLGMSYFSSISNLPETPLISQPEGSFLVRASEAMPTADQPDTQAPVHAPLEMGVEEQIRMRFGKNAEKALKIAKCESGMRPDAVGDKTLTFEKDGTTYGTSHGVFQIRSLPGRDMPNALHDVQANIEWAYHLSNGGEHWGAWRNCARKAGLL